MHRSFITRDDTQKVNDSIILVVDARYLTFADNALQLRRRLDTLTVRQLWDVRFLHDVSPNHWVRRAWGDYLSWKKLCEPEEVRFDGSWGPLTQ